MKLCKVVGTSSFYGISRRELDSTSKGFHSVVVPVEESSLRGRESNRTIARSAGECATKPVSDRATRYMGDGSILPRVSTSCDDLQRRITKSREERASERTAPAFTSPRLASPSRPTSGKIGARLRPGEGGDCRAALDGAAKGSVQTDLDLECSRYCSSSRRERRIVRVLARSPPRNLPSAPPPSPTG